MVLGENLKDVQSSAIFEGGVDILETIIMNFEGNKMATLQSGVREISDRMGSIFGTKGYIQVQNINNPEKITVFNPVSYTHLYAERGSRKMYFREA